MFAEQESLVRKSSRQMANCSRLEELQYEKHVHRDGDDITLKLA